jgi:hypothetical protein
MSINDFNYRNDGCDQVRNYPACDFSANELYSRHGTAGVDHYSALAGMEPDDIQQESLIAKLPP